MSFDNNVRPRHDLSNTPSINHWLFKYPFLFPLITELLHDEDVLESLLLTGKSIKPFLLNYPLKRWITQKSAQIYRSSTRYLSVVITRMNEVEDADLSSFRGLKEVRLCHNGSIKAGMFPNSITHIACDKRGEQESKAKATCGRMLPYDYYTCFNQPISIGCLPGRLMVLKLGQIFNHPLEVGTLPSSLRTLCLSLDFNQPLQIGCIPDSVSELDLGHNFNQLLVPGVIPDSVMRLTLSDMYAHPLLSGVIPNSVTSLTLTIRSPNLVQPSSIPQSVIKLGIQGHIPVGIIPTSVTHLRVGGKGFFAGRLSHDIAAHMIPASVTHLCINCETSILKDAIPSSVTHLMFGISFSQNSEPTHTIIPSSITHFALECGRLNKPICVPKTVQQFECRDEHKPHVKWSLGASPAEMVQRVILENGHAWSGTSRWNLWQS